MRGAEGVFFALQGGELVVEVRALAAELALRALEVPELGG